MSAAYIDETYIQAFIGLDVMQALFTTPSAEYSATHLGVAVNAASALVKMAAKNAGYTLGDTTTDDTVKLATLAEFIKMAPGMRKGLTVAQSFVDQFAGLMSAIANGTLPLDSDPDTVGGVGGSTFSETDTSVTPTADAPTFPPVFNRFTLRGY